MCTWCRSWFSNNQSFVKNHDTVFDFFKILVQPPPFLFSINRPCFFRRDFFADYFVKFYRLFCKFVTIGMAPKSENYDKEGGVVIFLMVSFVSLSPINKQSQQASSLSGCQVAATSWRPSLSNELVEIFFFQNFSLLNVVACSVKPLQLACRLFVQISRRCSKYFYGVQINFVVEGFSFNSQRSQQAPVLRELWNFLHQGNIRDSARYRDFTSELKAREPWITLESISYDKLAVLCKKMFCKELSRNFILVTYHCQCWSCPPKAKSW